MKNKGYKLIFLLMLLLPVTVKAYSGSVSLSCSPTTVAPSGNITCTVKGTIDGSDSVGQVEFTVAAGSGLSVTGFQASDSEWQGNMDSSNNKVGLYRADNLTGTFNIGTVTVKALADATPSTSSIEIRNATLSNGGTEASADNKSVSITISNASGGGGLSSLVPTGGTFGYQFTPERDSYLLTLNGDVTTFSLTATPQNAGDTVTFVNGHTNETLDPNNITFQTPADQETMLIKINVSGGKTYTIMVSKNVSSEATYELSSLRVGDQQVSLVSGKYDYTVTLNDTSSYVVEADLVDRTNYEISNLISPRSGEMSFTIAVIPKDSSSGLRSQTYTITVVNGNGGGDSTPAPASSVTPTPASSYQPVPSNNPQTGGAVSIIMALILLASFGTAIYYYKKNIGYFTK